MSKRLKQRYETMLIEQSQQGEGTGRSIQFNNELKLRQEISRLTKELDERTENLTELRKKDKISRCVELETELACYIDETVRMRDMIIALTMDNSKQKDQLAQLNQIQKGAQIAQQQKKSSQDQVARTQTQLKKERDTTEKLEDQIMKNDQERERLKMQNSILKSKITNLENMVTRDGSGLKKQKEQKSPNQVLGDQAMRDNHSLRLIIDRQRKEIDGLKRLLSAAQVQEEQFEIQSCPQDIQLIIYAIKKALLKNQIQIRQLAQHFSNPQDPFEEVLNKKQLKYRLKRFPFQLQNESKLIRFIEWVTEGQEHISINKFLRHLQKWVQPYLILPNKQTQDPQIAQSINQALFDKRDYIKDIFGLKEEVTMITACEIIQNLNLTNEQLIYLQMIILERVESADQVKLNTFLEPLIVTCVRSRSSNDQKRKQVPIRNLHYKPDYHFRKYGRQHANQIGFLEFLTPIASDNISKTFIQEPPSNERSLFYESPQDEILL